MMKKACRLLLWIFLGLGFIHPAFVAEKVLASEKQVSLSFFWGEGCPHCALEKPFLKELQQQYPLLTICEYEIWNNKENRELFVAVGNELKAEHSGVPFTVVCDRFFIGWHSEETTGAAIEHAVQEAQEHGCVDVVRQVLAPDRERKAVKERAGLIPATVKVPVFGEVETKNLSLPLFAVVMGGLDGFNPCAMWALVFLISLLLGMNDRKRMWILGSAFIITSAAVYLLFMAAWLNLLLFVGFIVWIRVIIGLIALGGGIYSLREFFVNKEGVCKVAGDEKRQKVFEQLKAITQKSGFWAALGGTILLAGAVNLVELICSAGLPVVFTQVLAFSNLTGWEYYCYLLLYIFVYMLDDLFVFFAAMMTLQLAGMTTKYTRWSHLIGGMLMAVIGILLIVKPEWLMFG